MMVSYMYKRKFSEYLIELKVAVHESQSSVVIVTALGIGVRSADRVIFRLLQTRAGT